GLVHVDGRHQSPVACRRRQRVLHLGTIFVDAGVVAGTVPHALTRHRHRFRVQRAALHRLPRPAVRRHVDRAIRRLRKGGDDLRLHLLPGIRRRPLPAGDKSEAAAGERVIGGGYFLSAISWTSGFHWATSWSICARYCSGVVLTVSAPALRMMSFTSGSSAILIRISDNLRMIGSGVFAGAMMPFHVSTTKSGTVSFTVGRSGK